MQILIRGHGKRNKCREMSLFKFRGIINTLVTKLFLSLRYIIW